MAQELQHKESLGNGEPLLQSRQLCCDASRKGLPWRTERASLTKTSESQETHRKNDRRPTSPRQKENVKKSIDKKVYITTAKKAQFSHMLPGQRDSCIHHSPIIYPRNSEQSRREVAPLWYHPFQAGY
jgi:hypothetical protein